MNREDVIDSALLGTWIAVAVGGLLAAVILAIDLAQSLQWSLTRPYSLSFTGGLLSYYIAHPFDLYQPADPVPHPTIYPPLVPLLTPSIPGVPTIITGRLVSWLAIAASSLMLAYHARRYSGRYGVAAVVAGVFILSPTFTAAPVILRVDHVALALTLAAITAWTRGWRLWAIVALSVAAAFAKQPYAVTAILPITLAYYLRDGKRPAVRYAIASSALGLLLLAVLTIVTDGWAFVHLVEYNAAIPLYADVFLSQTYSVLVKHSMTFAIAIGVLTRLDREEWADPLPWLFVVGLVVALATVGKEGSWIGYFYPAIAAGTVLLAKALPDVEIRQTMPTKRQVAVVTVLSLVVLQLAAFTLIDVTPQKSQDAQRDLQAYLADADGAVLSEDPSVVPNPGPPVDMFMVMGLVESGAVEGDPLADALRCGRYEYVVTWITVDSQLHQYRRWTETQQRAIENHYEWVYAVDAYSVYRYNGSAGC